VSFPVLDEHRLAATDAATLRLMNGRTSAWAGLDDVEALRDRAHTIRMEAIDDLEGHLARFVTALEAIGGIAHVCATAEEARATVTRICVEAEAKLAAKSKSMLTEEIELNGALEAAGIEVVETDLGEYILQLAGEHPVHIIAPAIEKTAGDVAALLSAVDGIPVEPELEALAQTARRQLRRVFERADVGITGANFAVCDTGSICLVTNEGNGGLVTALPRVHVALLGLERLVPTLDDLMVLIQLLARSGTGQTLTTYTRLLTGPRRAGEEDGPEEMHVVIVDNGRTGLRRGRYKEMLACIRCGACLNVCPIYRKSGGGAYGPVYSGPMGAVLLPLLHGLEREPGLPHASSLCGACTAACPVKIPLHELLLDLRRDLVGEGLVSRTERFAFTAWSFLWSNPRLYRFSTRLARTFQRFGALAGPGRTWAKGRELPSLARRRYRDGR
jgi:L-lactate dehydrogenase complex protein LldF